MAKLRKKVDRRFCRTSFFMTVESMQYIFFSCIIANWFLLIKIN